MNTTVVVGFCPSCKHEIRRDFKKSITRDVAQVTEWKECPICSSVMPIYLRVPIVPSTISHTYMSYMHYPYPAKYNPDLPYGDLLFFITSEAYIWLRGDKYNGFIKVASSEEIPPITSVSVPSTSRIFRSDFPPDILYILTSIVVSGILGNLAYDIVKATALRVWRELTQSRNRTHEALLRVSDTYIHIKTNEEEEILRAIEIIHDYSEHRLRGIDRLRLPDSPFGQVVLLLRERQAWSSREISERLGIPPSQVVEILKALGATYHNSGPNRSLWTIDPALLR